MRKTGSLQTEAGTDVQADKTVVLAFARRNCAAALATADKDGNPDVAIVYCTVQDDFSLYFTTRIEGRKYRNITSRTTVALAFYNEAHLQTLRLYGDAMRVNDMDIESQVFKELFTLRQDSLPTLQLYEKHATNEIAVIRVVPTEITFADFHLTAASKNKAIFNKIL